MTDLTRLPISDAAWCALVDHAVSLGDLSEIGHLELKGTLPFGTPADRKKSAVIIARAVLGMGNRMPDVAERHLDGHGVVLVGVAKNAVTGAEQVDPADLSNLLEQYVGIGGPGWEPRFVQHPDGLVLAIVVYPPKLGDPPHACRKQYTGADSKIAVNDGDVFVRRSGKTERANSAELAALLRRSQQAPGVGAQVAVAYQGGFSVPDKRMLNQDLIEKITEYKDSLLAGIKPPERPKPSNTGAPGTLLASLMAQQSAASGALSKFTSHDDGRRQRYRGEVEEWYQEALAEIPVLMVEVIRHYAARGHWQITNLSTRFLEDVRVEVLLPVGVQVLSMHDSNVNGDVDEFSMWDSLPERPAKWDTWNRSAGIWMPDFDKFSIPRVKAQVFAPSEFDVERSSDGGTRVTWHLGTLRPEAPEQGETEFVLALDLANDADAPATIEAKWRVTARDVHHVFTGALTVDRDVAAGPDLDL